MYSQDTDPVIFTINDVPTYKSEFIRALNKNNEIIEQSLSTRDFLQSYIELKMNVEEAKAQQLDTLSKYKNELEAYRAIIAEPYLVDTTTERAYTRKIYDRLTENIEMNHYIVPFKQELILPKDTMEVYKKAMEVRNKILQQGFEENFLKEELPENNIYLGMEGRNGYLGWITPFILSPILEEAVYSAPLGEISMPIRTASGYHIIQVLNRQKATGSSEIEQVMFRFPQIPPSQHHIDSVKAVAEKEYEHVKSNNNFQTLCDAFSEAYKTGDKGCYFGIVGLDSNLSPEFLTAVSNLKNRGDISRPVISDYGFHIVRLLRKIPVPSYNSIKGQLLQKIKSGNRVYDMNREKRINTFAKVDMKVNESAYSKIMTLTSSMSPRDSSFTTFIKNESELLVTIDNQREVPTREFSRYIKYRQNLLKTDPNELEMMSISEAMPYNLSTDILNEYFYSFLNILALNHIEVTLEERHPEVRNIMSDFSEGLLFYEVKNKNIWQRSKTDEQGLANTFEINKDKYRMSSPKYKGLILYAKDNKSLKEAEKIAQKEKNTEKTIEAIRKKLNKKSVSIKLEPGIWAKGENQCVDFKAYGGEQPKLNKDYPFFSVVGEKITSPQEYRDVRDEVEKDYQERLEKEWDSFLYNKYKVNINETILESIK